MARCMNTIHCWASDLIDYDVCIDRYIVAAKKNLFSVCPPHWLDHLFACSFDRSIDPFIIFHFHCPLNWEILIFLDWRSIHNDYWKLNRTVVLNSAAFVIVVVTTSLKEMKTAIQQHAPNHTNNNNNQNRMKRVIRK